MQVPAVTCHSTAFRVNDNRQLLAHLQSLVSQQGKDRFRRVLGSIREQLDRESEPSAHCVSVSSDFITPSLGSRLLASRTTVQGLRSHF